MVKNNSKRKTRFDKYPLTLHPTGQFCKKIRGKLYYFGTNKKEAFRRYIDEAAYLQTGVSIRTSRTNNNVNLLTLCNLYLEQQNSRIEAGEIKMRQVYDQTTFLRDFVKYLGRSRKISEVATIDLQKYRMRLIKQGKSNNRINNYISAVKAMYHWATENELIATVPNLKAIKKLPKPKTTKPIFSPDEVHKLLKLASPKIKAMILLGLNCGFGCTDCAELLWENVDLKKGRINFPRTKTGVFRNLPLWKETLEALRILPKINERLFNTEDNKKVVRCEQKIAEDKTVKVVKVDRVSRDFSGLMKRAGINKGKGVGFYTLRRTAATLAARSGDPFAVQHLLGHADLKMATTYVQDISEQTDRVINNSRKLIIQDGS